MVTEATCCSRLLARLPSPRQRRASGCSTRHTARCPGESVGCKPESLPAEETAPAEAVGSPPAPRSAGVSTCCPQPGANHKPGLQQVLGRPGGDWHVPSPRGSWCAGKMDRGVDDQCRCQGSNEQRGELGPRPGEAARAQPGGGPWTRAGTRVTVSLLQVTTSSSLEMCVWPGMGLTYAIPSSGQGLFPPCTQPTPGDLRTRSTVTQEHRNSHHGIKRMPGTTVFMPAAHTCLRRRRVSSAVLLCL